MSSTTSVAASTSSAGPSLVDRAKELGPALRDRCAETNDLLAPAARRDVERLDPDGIVRALQPARWGGGEVDYKEFYSAISEVARVEGCAGWVAGVVGFTPLAIASILKRHRRKCGAMTAIP